MTKDEAKAIMAEEEAHPLLKAAMSTRDHSPASSASRVASA